MAVGKKKVKAKKCPAMFVGLFNVFVQLSKQRADPEGIPQKIAWQAIEAWQNLWRYPLAGHELRLLGDLDEIYVNEMRRKIAGRKN